MMLELAVADAYGACFETLSAKDIGDTNDLSYHKRLQPSIIKRGKYTDDAQMSIAVAEAVLEREEWTPLFIAHKFVEAFRRDPRRGYTGPFFNILTECQTGGDLIAKVDGKSRKGGGCMRAGPCGLYPDIQEVEERAVNQAIVTHNSTVGVMSAAAAAFMVHYFAYDLGKKEDLREWMHNHNLPTTRTSGTLPDNEGEFRVWEPGQPVGNFGWSVVLAALTAIERTDSLAECLKQCVAWGGDTDTVATVALAAASWSKEMKKDLPVRLVDALENKRYGKDYLIELDNKLKAKFGL
jgi:ADP-ribosyl-[dinitrogen reductase] hydrolase